MAEFVSKSPTSGAICGSRWSTAIPKPRSTTVHAAGIPGLLGQAPGHPRRAAVSCRRGASCKQATFLIFNQQFLTLIKAGLPILTALDLLIKRQRDNICCSLLENVRERVKGGELLSDAFAAQRCSRRCTRPR